MTAVDPLRPAGDGAAAATEALAAVIRHLDRCKLAARTVRAYKRQAAAYAAWLTANARAHGDAFADLVGAEGAVTAWKRDMLTARSSPATVNQALAAVTLMYEQSGLRIAVKRVRIPRPGEPGALTRQQEAALRRAAARRGPRDSAIIAVLLDTGARAGECARLDAGDFAITARTREVRLHGKGDEVRSVPLARRSRELISAWLDVRGRHPGPIWTGQRGPLTISGITQVVLATGDDTGIPGLRPHRCRHTFATRLQGRGVASDASFGTSREHALPAAQRAALRRLPASRPAGAPCGYGDLGFHGPPGSDATMMRLMPLRGVHHRGACWHSDASGYGRLHRRITGGPGERCPAGAAAARDAPDLRITGHLTRLTWQPAALVAPGASHPAGRCSRGRRLARQLPGTPAGLARRGRGRHASQWPAGGRSWPGPAPRLGRSAPVLTNLGSSLQEPAPAEVFGMVRNPLPTSWQGGADPAQVQALLGHATIDTAARYFRAGSAENAEVVERVFAD